MGGSDETLPIGTANQARMWITGVLPALAKMERSSTKLLDLTPAVYLKLFHHSRRLAKLDKAGPHQLRHGGASCDGLTDMSDLTLADRGRWAAVASVRRYREPAQYIKRLRILTPQ